jgi:hypothetical protein
MANPTKTALALMKERGIHKCQVEGCDNDGEEAHHCLMGKSKGICDLNLYENLQLVCRSCHKYTGKAKTWENRKKFWLWACGFYGREHMMKWLEEVPLKIKPKYELVKGNEDED